MVKNNEDDIDDDNDEDDNEEEIILPDPSPGIAATPGEAFLKRKNLSSSVEEEYCYLSTGGRRTIPAAKRKKPHPSLSS